VFSFDDKPVRNAAVVLVSWKELPFPKWEARTDSEGRFTWDSAPLDGALYTVRAPGFGSVMPQPLQPGETEAVFKMVASGMFIGTVVDAETGKPIPDFQVIRGQLFGIGTEDTMWDRSQVSAGTDGKYAIAGGERYSMSVRLLVEAEGYLPQASGSLTAQGWVTNDFRLKKGSGPTGVVKSPSGEPVEGAQVALLTGDYTRLKDRELVRSGGSEQKPTLVRTDTNGKFALPAAYATELVVVHSKGYAEVMLPCLSTNLDITLQPWGIIKGVVRNGRNPATNVTVMVTGRKEGGFGTQLQYEFDSYRVESDEQGRFVLKDVPPGERYLVRLYKMDRGWSWSHGEVVTVKAGGETEILFGGKGRAIKGKIVPSDPKREIPWQLGHKILGTRQPRPPSSFRTQQEIESWYNQPEVKEARAKYRYYVVQFEEDGSFKVDEVLPGVYDLNCRFHEPSNDQFGNMGEMIGMAEQEVVVPEMPDGQIDEPMDLGKIDMEVRSSRK
jgi:hypothetical protein